MRQKADKRRYIRPAIQVIMFNNEDILTKSGNCGHHTSGAGGSGCFNRGHECNQNNGNH